MFKDTDDLNILRGNGITTARAPIDWAPVRQAPARDQASKQTATDSQAPGAGGAAPLGNNRNVRPSAPAKDLRAANPPSPSPFGRAYDTRKLRHRVRAALAGVNYRLKIKHPMNGCGQFAGFSGKNEQTGKMERHKTINLMARWDAEAGRVVVHQSHVASCGSALICPVCGARILQRRREEVEKAIKHMLLVCNYRMIMVTLTARHDFQTELAPFIYRFNRARDMLFGSRKWKDYCQKIGKMHHIYATEITLDDMEYKNLHPSGWHYHLHYIMFYKNDDSALMQQFSDVAKYLWVHCLQAKGLDGRTDIALDIELMNDRASIADNIETATQYMIKDAAWEVSGAAMKEGRKASRMSIRDLQLILAFRRKKIDKKTYKHYENKWKEYVEAVKKLPSIFFSHGLKALCGIEEKTDKEIVEEGTSGDIILHTWRVNDKNKGTSPYMYIGRQGGQGYLLGVVQGKIDDNAAMQQFVQKCEKATKEEKKSLRPPKMTAKIREFAQQSTELAADGYDVEPYAVNDAGENLHMMLHRTFSNVTCRCATDFLPDVRAGKLLRDARKWNPTDAYREWEAATMGDYVTPPPEEPSFCALRPLSRIRAA